MKDIDYQVQSITRLEQADPVKGTVVWDKVRSVWNNLMFSGALVLPFFATSGGAVLLGLLLGAVTIILGHSIGYHRLMIHRSFKCPKWLEYFLIYMGVLVGMGGPLWTRKLHDTRDWAQRQSRCHSFLRHKKTFFWRVSII